MADCARFRFVAEADTKAAPLLFADCGQGICAGDALAFGATQKSQTHHVGPRTTAGSERHQPRRPSRPRLPVRPGDAAPWRRQPGPPSTVSHELLDQQAQEQQSRWHRPDRCLRTKPATRGAAMRPVPKRPDHPLIAGSGARLRARRNPDTYATAGAPSIRSNKSFGDISRSGDEHVTRIVSPLPAHASVVGGVLVSAERGARSAQEASAVGSFGIELTVRLVMVRRACPSAESASLHGGDPRLRQAGRPRTSRSFPRSAPVLPHRRTRCALAQPADRPVPRGG